MASAHQIAEMLDMWQTPFYLFDEQAVRRRIGAIRNNLPYGTRICYAMKANPFILRVASQTCDAVEVCSPGELDICRCVGTSSEQIVVSGVYKEPNLMRELISSGEKVHRYTIESVSQFELIESIAREENACVSVLMRLTSGNQFGMDAHDLKRIMHEHRQSRHVRCCGVQYFSGTQKSSWKKLVREIDMLDTFMAELEQDYGCDSLELEYGPGLPVDYCEPNGRLAGLADWELISSLGGALASMRFGGALTLELGRAIAADCGTYVTRVVDIKRNHGHNYAIVDGGKHQMVYYGQALALRSPKCAVYPARDSDAPEAWTICGALCTTSDVMAKSVGINDLHVGDCVVFPNAGAYCMTEGLSLFLSRELPSVYLTNGFGAPRLVRDRIETSGLNTPVE